MLSLFDFGNNWQQFSKRSLLPALLLLRKLFWNTKLWLQLCAATSVSISRHTRRHLATISSNNGWSIAQANMATIGNNLGDISLGISASMGSEQRLAAIGTQLGLVDFGFDLRPFTHLPFSGNYLRQLFDGSGTSLSRWTTISIWQKFSANFLQSTPAWFSRVR